MVRDMSDPKPFLQRNGRFMLALVCFGLLRLTVADYMLVPSGSMNPTLLEGDYILANRTAWGLRIPFTSIQLTRGTPVRRGDIAVFKSPEDGQTLVKRVIGMPGDTVEMKDDQLVVNGEPFAYPPAAKDLSPALLEKTRVQPHLIVDEVAQSKGVLLARTHHIMLMPAIDARRDFAQVKVPAGQFLMLGDNRDNSRDSRFIGLVPRANLIGRARYVMLSLNPDNHFLPRLERTWKALS